MLLEVFFEVCLLVLLLPVVLGWRPKDEEPDTDSARPPLVAFVTALVEVAPTAANDDGVMDPAMDAFGVILGPPPEVVDGDAWEPGEDDNMLACIAETYFTKQIIFYDNTGASFLI